MHQNGNLQYCTGYCWVLIVGHFTDHPPEESPELFLEVLFFFFFQCEEFLKNRGMVQGSVPQATCETNPEVMRKIFCASIVLPGMVTYGWL